MTKIPEGAETTTAEGSDVRAAVETAAKSLGVSPKQVAYKLDLSHFRSETGSTVARQTVKVIAWAKPASEVEEVEEEAPKPKRERKPRKPKAAPKAEEPEDDDSEDEAPAAAPAPKGESTKASAFAETWFRKLLGLMDVKGTVAAVGDDERIELTVTADKAGRIIGRRGMTLSAIRHLLKLSLEDMGDFTIDVEIPDDRDGKKKSRSRRDDDRGDRRGGRDRGDRGGRSDRGDRRGGRSEYSEEMLLALGKRAAEKAMETGRTITINKVLNSHDRRLVHMAVSEVEGADSNSVMKDGKKYIQVAPEFEADEDTD